MKQRKRWRKGSSYQIEIKWIFNLYHSYLVFENYLLGSWSPLEHRVIGEWWYERKCVMWVLCSGAALGDGSKHWLPILHDNSHKMNLFPFGPSFANSFVTWQYSECCLMFHVDNYKADGVSSYFIHSYFVAVKLWKSRHISCCVIFLPLLC